MAALGALLLVIGSIGWWLSTRVLDADGFADVAAKASQHVEVREYIADQFTLPPPPRPRPPPLREREGAVSAKRAVGST